LLNVVGDKVALGPLRRELMPLYVRWANDFEVTRTLGIGMRPLTLEAEESWYERATKEENAAHFSIYERSTMRPIGNASLMSIDATQRTAEFGILIGEKDCWGRGYGTETARLILDYGFTARSLNLIYLRAYSFNERGLRAYARAGFKPAGRLRQAHWLAGRPYDLILMDCLAGEFTSPVLGRLAPNDP
jgi:RimJ/RimL family protein N-acetyltransferase